MRHRPVTLDDVARTAGVSRSTASEALSGRGRMTTRTRQAVRDAAGRLGYLPNRLARGLRTGRTHAIGLHHLHAADNFESQYFREFVAGVMDVTRVHDYDLSLLSSDPTRPRATHPQVDGIIIADPIADDLRAAELLGSGIPVIAGERYPPGMPTSPVVGIRHETALREILDHAYAQGARRPMLIGPDENSGWGVVLHRAFQAWCTERGLSGAHLGITFVTGFRDEQRRILDDSLAGKPAVDLVVVPGEHVAMAALATIRARSLAAGRDVLLATCADARLLHVSDPPVTAIDLRPRCLGAACAGALIAMLDEQVPPPDLRLLPARAMLRASTRGPLVKRAPSGTRSR